MKDFWNERYAAKKYAYGETPNAYFQSQLQDIKPGKILLPADGEGRNAVYAAQNGWEVSAFDYSLSAKEKALTLAQTQGVDIDFQTCDVMDFHFPTEHFQAIGLFYAHLPLGLRRYLHQKVISSLQVGGVLIFEAFAKGQLNFASGGPKNASFLFSKKELTEEFKGLNISYLEELEVDLQEGLYHQGPASVVRLIAKK